MSAIPMIMLVHVAATLISRIVNALKMGASVLWVARKRAVCGDPARLIEKY